MKIVIAGGYGVFGSRLAELLIRDGHEVVIAGRRLDKARALADKLGCAAQALNLRDDPDALLNTSPQVVVDAAGPFQAYGKDPYAIPRLCIEHGIDYLDLSDSADFTSGLSALDDLACRNDRRILSGVSSVPGVSSAVAADLCDGLEEVLLIESAIVPGNRAPRGASVIASIVSQLGTRGRVWRGGRWREQPCWGDARRVRLGGGLVRTARFIEVPDIRLFPEFFKARSVMFRAGMELPALSAAMWGVGLLRRLWRFEVTPRRTGFFRWIADLFRPFGTNRGGMSVAVVGLRDGVAIRREWRLVAEAGHGPYVPAVVARAVIRRLDRVAPGARPCLAEVNRKEVEDAMSDLSVSTAIDETLSPTLFQLALADRWERLSPEAQALHSVQDMESFSGTAQVVRGRSLIARAAAWFFGFPPATDSVPVTVTKTRTEKGETWVRDFGGRVFRSYCTPAPSPYRYRESFWLFNYELDLTVEDDTMHLPVRRGWFLGVPMPRFLLPMSESMEYASDGFFHFDVALGAPLGGGLIVRYRGWLIPDPSDPPQMITSCDRKTVG